MTLGELLAHAERRGARVRPINQAWGQAYEQLYLLERSDEAKCYQTSVTGEREHDLEDEIVGRVCRTLNIPHP